MLRSMFFFASNAKVDIGCFHNRSKGDPVKRVGGKMITIFSSGHDHPARQMVCGAIQLEIIHTVHCFSGPNV